MVPATPLNQEMQTSTKFLIKEMPTFGISADNGFNNRNGTDRNGALRLAHDSNDSLIKIKKSRVNARSRTTTTSPNPLRRSENLGKVISILAYVELTVVTGIFPIVNVCF